MTYPKHSQIKLHRVELLMELHLRATGCHLPRGIRQYYLPSVTSEHLNPGHPGWCSIYLPQRDGRPSSPRLLVAPEMFSCP